MFTVLAWNNMLPDRRDCLIFGLLPVRTRTVFLAKLAALATSSRGRGGSAQRVYGAGLPVRDRAARQRHPGGAARLRGVLDHDVCRGPRGMLRAARGAGYRGQSPQLSAVSEALQLPANGGVFRAAGRLFPEASLSAPGLRGSPSFWFLGLFQKLNGARRLRRAGRARACGRSRSSARWR